MMVEEICKRYGILALYAFGSKALEAVKLASGEKLQPEVDYLSDIDIGVVFFQKPRNVSERLRLYKTLYAELSEVFSPYQLDLTRNSPWLATGMKLW